MKTNAMKTLKLMLVSACLFASSWTCFAQEEEYHPFLENDKWLVVLNTFEGSNNRLVFVDRDTIINGLIYYKLKYKFIKLPKVFNYPFVTYNDVPLDYPHLLREEANSKKVFLRVWGKYETLLYDFNLVEGDTMPNNATLILSKIDSVQINVGFRKRFVFNSTKDNSYQAIWVEGIGNVQDPLDQSRIYDSKDGIFCAYSNNQITYENCILFCDCLDYLKEGSGINQTIKTGNYKVYPNPVKNNFYIYLDNGTIKSVRIIGLNGRLVKNVGDNIGTNFIDNIDISSLSSGIYLCVVTTLNGEVGNFKVVKE
jgi:Secretion system C-terminal sorting domain